MEELPSFIFKNLFLILLAVFALISFIFHYKSRNRELFDVNGDQVLINRTSKLRFSFVHRTAIHINSVVRVEVHGNRLSLFQRSNNAIDIWLHAEHLESGINKAKSVFSHADFSSKGS